MKLRHSDSLILVWRVAEIEARHLKSSTIEPTHLLLGLCKTVDLDLPSLVSKDAPDRNEVLEELLREVRRLKNVFRAAGLNAKIFRRRLRRIAEAHRFILPDSGRLRRGKAAKQVFAEAEHFAALVDCMVYPVHLLYAALLADDRGRDKVLNDLGIDKLRLLEVTKRETVFHQGDSMPRDKTHLN